MTRVCAGSKGEGPRTAGFGFLAGGLITLFTLSACMGLEEEPRADIGHLGADFGNAVSHNAAQHIIDPAPAHAFAGPPNLDGVRAAEAINRYRSGTVIAPEAMETSGFGERR